LKALNNHGEKASDPMPNLPAAKVAGSNKDTEFFNTETLLPASMEVRAHKGVLLGWSTENSYNILPCQHDHRKATQSAASSGCALLSLSLSVTKAQNMQENKLQDVVALVKNISTRIGEQHSQRHAML
jgi:hypothetical protein